MSTLLLDVDAGRAVPLHRLALAVTPVDAVSRAPAGPGLRIGRETVRSVDAALRTSRPGRVVAADPTEPLGGPYAAGAVLTHRLVESDTAVVRIDDPRRRWVPRRISIPLWTLADVEASDRLVDPANGRVTQPHGPYVVPPARQVAPWLLPSSAYRLPATATAVRSRVLRADGTPVRWARVEAFDAGGATIGWAHGDERGEVLLLWTVAATFPAPGTVATAQIALRVHWPDPQAAPPDEVLALLRAGDQLADLPMEPFPRAPNAAAGPPDALATGESVPAGYLTAADQVVTVDVGRENHVAALQLPV